MCSGKSHKSEWFWCNFSSLWNIKKGEFIAVNKLTILYTHRIFVNKDWSLLPPYSVHTDYRLNITHAKQAEIKCWHLIGCHLIKHTHHIMSLFLTAEEKGLSKSVKQWSVCMLHSHNVLMPQKQRLMVVTSGIQNFSASFIQPLSHYEPSLPTVALTALITSIT